MTANGGEERWTIYVHDDGEYVSINDGIHGDTLLKMPEGWRDRDRVKGFVAAFTASAHLLDEAREERDAAVPFVRPENDPGDQWRDYLATNLLDALERVSDTGDWYGAVAAWCRVHRSGRIQPNPQPESEATALRERVKELAEAVLAAEKVLNAGEFADLDPIFALARSALAGGTTEGEEG